MSIKDNVKNLAVTIRPYRAEMTFAIISSLLKQASIICCAAVTSYMVGLAMEKQLTKKVPVLFLILSCCILGRAIFNHLEMYLAHDVAFRVIRDFRIQIYRKLNELAPAYTIRKQTGQIAQAFVGDVEILELFLAHTFSSFIVAGIVAVIIFCVLLTISAELALMLILFMVLLASIPYMMRKKAEKQGDAVRSLLAENNSIMTETVQGLREIIILNSKDNSRKKIQNSNQQLYDAQAVYGRRKGSESMMNHMLTGLFTVAVMLISAKLVYFGRIGFALYPVTVMLSTVVLNPAMEVASVAQEMGIVFSASNRIQSLLKEQPVVKDSGKEILSGDTFAVEFRNVAFAYEADKPILKNVSFTINPGENVALVGCSGVGKTTCSNLLMRYYDCAEGQILINGKDIRDFSVSSLRQKLSVVSQETYLFHESVLENIKIGKPDSSSEAIKTAAVIANADQFIQELPMGYDTITGERGYRLSGGQRQRIAIARAILRNSPIIVFDEAVSSLDSENEMQIQSKLKQYLDGKTVLTIAHRLSTILTADKIVMLKDGKVCAVGCHHDLMESNDEYRELIHTQTMDQQ